MNVIEWLLVGVTVAVMLVAVYTDVRWGKILNAFTAPIAVLGLILNAINGGWPGLGTSLLGMFIGVALWFVCNIFGRILGAGDSKLLAAMGALQGYIFIIYAAAATALIGGVMAIIVALYRGYLKKSIVNLVRHLYARIFHKIPIDIESAAPEARLPYAIPIFCGGLFALYYLHFYLP